jgi:RNA polymerase sigma-70 factor, ECF subfamily
MSLRGRVRAGDPDAFGVLFDEYAHAVYNHAYRLTGNWSAAEEVVSLTFLEAWRRRHKVEPEGGPLRPWLLGIAVNVTRNLSRATRRHRAAMVRLPPADAAPDFADDLAGRIDDAAHLEAVRAALGKLRRSEREVIALCVWSGLGYAEAAQALGVPVGTVRSRLSRARDKLRKLIAEAAAPGSGHRGSSPGTGSREPARRTEQLQGGRDNAARPTRGGANR